MSSPMHGHDLRPRIKSRVDKRVRDMVTANGGPEKCLGKPSATGLGVHIIFRSEESLKPTTSPRSRPRPRPSTSTPQKEEDVEMVGSSESSSGSDTNTAEHTPRHEKRQPSSTLNAPKVLRRTEDRRPEDWNGGSLASADGRVADSMEHIAKRRLAPYSDLRDIEAARRRVDQQRLLEARRIRLEQLEKGAKREAQLLRQRADDLEREASEELERLLRGETEVGEVEEEQGRSMAMEGDGDDDQSDVRSDWSYAPTEVYPTDDDDQPRWSSPAPSLSLPVSSPIPTHSYKYQ